MLIGHVRASSPVDSGEPNDHPGPLRYRDRLPFSRRPDVLPIVNSICILPTTTM